MTVCNDHHAILHVRMIYHVPRDARAPKYPRSWLQERVGGEHGESPKDHAQAITCAHVHWDNELNASIARTRVQHEYKQARSRGGVRSGYSRASKTRKLHRASLTSTHASAICKNICSTESVPLSVSQDFGID